jgi:secondary thiamine-phosphate synthase enzyme
MVRQELLQIPTANQRQLIEITEEVRSVVRNSGVEAGLCHVFAAGATAAVVVHEGDDPALQDDLLDLLDQRIPQGRWRHDRIDDNGAAHLCSAWIGPSEILPVRQRDLGLGTWQRLFLCEFDGPRRARPVWVTVLGEQTKEE